MKTNSIKSGKQNSGSVNITINGREYCFRIGNNFGEIKPSSTLAHTLRETLALTGTKISCDRGACGTCSVIMDGNPVLSCSILTAECDGSNILTIEGLIDPDTGALDPLQQAFIDHNAFQCGFCTPGIIMTVKALLNKNKNPDENEVMEALSGNFCRCISHYHVIRAVMSVIDDTKEQNE
ncbi:MAG: (2Fe-2S)-binding protein [Spirochaetes bacterium]|nr:(2Fe-2S)-binding protein [Spirochaetota bacterium]